LPTLEQNDYKKFFTAARCRRRHVHDFIENKLAERRNTSTADQVSDGLESRSKMTRFRWSAEVDNYEQGQNAYVKRTDTTRQLGSHFTDRLLVNRFAIFY
jgi:hypothetical protein